VAQKGDVEKPEAEVERLHEELRQEHDRLLRALADFENYRRRTERDQADAARRGKRELILPLLDLLDDFDRALAHVHDAPPAVSQGLAAVQRKLIALLAGAGVNRFETVGERFDPRFHEAIGTVASDEVPSGSIAEVLQHGYLWNQEVLRPARVRVAQ
jgi:molecular chaperone GrpE